VTSASETVEVVVMDVEVEVEVDDVDVDVVDVLDDEVGTAVVSTKAVEVVTNNVA
jgi:hypothetical protein